jgi:hypothetical protein
VVGCKASVNAEAKASGRASADGEADLSGQASGSASGETDADGEPLPDYDQPLETPQAEDAPRGAGSAETALLGARHDLSYNGKPNAQCRCVAAALGNPTDEKFAWEAAIPSTNPSQQLVIALTSNGVACDTTVEGLGASYRGYRVVGNDVIVDVEVGKPGRPITAGGIIPKPLEDGAVYLASTNGAPYGASLSGDGAQCRLGNPGPRRVAVVPGAGTGEVPQESLDSAGQDPTELGESESWTDNSSKFQDTSSSELFNEEDAHTRDGFILGLNAGVGYLAWKASSGPVDITIDGIGPQFELMLGGSPTRDLGLGVILGGLSGLNPKASGTGAALFGISSLNDIDPDAVSMSTEVDIPDATVNLLRFGLFVDYYFMQDAGLHLLGEASLINFSITGTNGSADSAGFGLGAGLGYDWWIGDHWSMGLLGRFLWGKLSDEGFGVSPTILSPALLLTVTHH